MSDKKLQMVLAFTALNLLLLAFHVKTGATDTHQWPDFGRPAAWCVNGFICMNCVLEFASCVLVIFIVERSCASDLSLA